MFVVRLFGVPQFDSGSFHFVLKGCWFLPNMEQKSAEFLAGGRAHSWPFERGGREEKTLVSITQDTIHKPL